MKRHEMRRKDKEVTDPRWMEAVLKRGRVLHLGMAGEDGWPYVVTIGYGYGDGAIYMHGAPAGRKNDMLAANPRVCFQVALDIETVPGEAAADFTMKYRSVTGFGRVSSVTDPEERRKGLNILMDQYGGPHVSPEDAGGGVWVARLDIESMTGKRSVYTD